jgi:transposase
MTTQVVRCDQCGEAPAIARGLCKRCYNAWYYHRVRGGGAVGPPRWTPVRIVEAMRLWKQEHGRPPTSIDWQYVKPDRPAARAVAKVFGSWNTAIAAAGFEPISKNGAGASRFAAQMLAQRKQGDTFHAIAERYGCTRERVRQLIKKECDRTGLPFPGRPRALSAEEQHARQRAYRRTGGGPCDWCGEDLPRLARDRKGDRFCARCRAEELAGRREVMMVLWRQGASTAKIATAIGGISPVSVTTAICNLRKAGYDLPDRRCGEEHWRHRNGRAS